MLSLDLSLAVCAARVWSAVCRAARRPVAVVLGYVVDLTLMVSNIHTQSITVLLCSTGVEYGEPTPHNHYEEQPV